MVASARSVSEWLPSWASAAGFVLLAAAVVLAGRLPLGEALWMSASVAVAFLPSGGMAGCGWRRRAAESSLIPAAAALLLVADLTLLRMLMPPLLSFAAAAAAIAALGRVSVRCRPILIGALGLAIRFAGGVGISGSSWWAIAIAVVASALAPWAASHWGRSVGILAAMVVGVMPVASWAALVLVTLVAVWLFPWGRAGSWPEAVALRWLPAAAAIAALGSSVAPWGGIDLQWAFPDAGVLACAVLLLAAIASARMPPAAAGALWFAAAIAIGPAQLLSPERRAVRLTEENSSAVLPAGSGGSYVIDVALWGARLMVPETPVAIVSYAGGERILRAGRETVDARHRLVEENQAVQHPLPDRPVWRPSRIGFDSRWRVAGRSVLEVAAGESPVVHRLPELPRSVRVSVDTAGPSLPIPPRDWRFVSWLWATAAVVALLQIASGGWRTAFSVVPWCLLTVGQVGVRAAVEPLHLAGERYGVDLCLAALLAAWLPAALGWARKRRLWLAAASLLVPLALATPHLTPPLYGDEPFHLLVLESLAEDRDLDISNNLDVSNKPANSAYAISDRLLHSPVLALLLLPGYLVAGRSGALLLLAISGAAVVALVGRRSEQLGLPEWRRIVLALGLAVTYPLATFSTQIWPAVAGALAVAAMLAIQARGRLGVWLATALTLLATAIKTRLALVTFPAALVLWLRGGRRRRALGALVLGAVGLLGLAVGWWTMGHPFGHFRRVGDLIPTDWIRALRVVGGLAFDHAGGLAVAAPLLLVAVALLPLLWRRGGAGERAVIVGGALTVGVLLHSEEWYGGGSPPARYLVPLLPVLALAWGAALRWPLRWRRLGELLLPPSLFIWWALVTRPHFSVNPGDGGWWLADALARRFAADTQQFFPSFLVPTTATYLFPPIVACGGLAVAWLTQRRAGSLRLLLRLGVALWVLAAATLTLAITSRNDRIVEVEAPQVRRWGGAPVPPEGTPSRFTHRTAWRIGNGEAVIVPLKLRPGSSVGLTGWLVGRARDGAVLHFRWNDGPTTSIEVSGYGRSGRVPVPEPPGGGRHRLWVSVDCPKYGAAVLDRVEIEQR
jgi:hypothetical protein